MFSVDLLCHNFHCPAVAGPVSAPPTSRSRQASLVAGAGSTTLLQQPGQDEPSSTTQRDSARAASTAAADTQSPRVSGLALGAMAAASSPSASASGAASARGVFDLVKSWGSKVRPARFLVEFAVTFGAGSS